MKYSLEDLLKQVYEQKEIPSQKFCQTVLQEMREREGKASFWNRDLIYQKGILAAICTGMAVLIGFGMVHWPGGVWNQETASRQDIAERENLTPAVTEDPVGVKNRVETEEMVDAENPTDPENEVETENPTDRNNTAGTDQIPGNGQKHRKDPDSPVSEETDFDIWMPERDPTAEPEGQSTGVSEMDGNKDSGNQKPPVQKTTAPMETVKPPENTPRPQENYILLCSVETYTFSMGVQYPNEDEPIAAPGGILSDRMILSYEKLQTLVRELENSLDWKADENIQEFLKQLKRYDENYFVSNALCISMVSLHAGMDLRLRAVWVRDMGQGNRYLDIWMDKVSSQTDQSSDMRYYSSVVCVPREIAEQCSMVQFQYSARE